MTLSVSRLLFQFSIFLSISQFKCHKEVRIKLCQAYGICHYQGSISRPGCLESSAKPLSYLDTQNFEEYTSMLNVLYCFKKNGQSRPLFVYFQSFQSNILQFTTKLIWKCTSSSRPRDSNSQPDYESPPLSTRPRLPPYGL